MTITLNDAKHFAYSPLRIRVTGAFEQAWVVLKAVGDRPDDPPRQCANCGQMTRSWITPQGVEAGIFLCIDCYTNYHATVGRNRPQGEE